MRVQSTDAEDAAKAAEPARQPAEAAPAFYKRRRKRDNEIGQVLLRKGVITPVQLRQALKIQGEQGGHVGAILRRMGACDARAIAEALIEQVRTARAKGRDRNLVHAARQNPSIVGLRMPCRPKLVVALLFFADLVSLVLAAAVMWWLVSDDVLSITQRVVLASLVPLCLLAMLAVHLYEVTPPSPPEEIRRTTLVITLVYLGAWTVSVAARIVSAKSLSHGGWLLALALSVALLPIVRGILRSTRTSHASWASTEVAP